MSFVDKIKNKAEELAGKAKEKIGDATGNEDLKRDGQADQADAGLKQTVEHVKDGATDAKDAVKDTFKKN
ncbi:MAG: CsbD family protein [Actinomycetota bacterium]|nr:CsbD family protein [Actinomycetota bacterium]